MKTYLSVFFFYSLQCALDDQSLITVIIKTHRLYSNLGGIAVAHVGFYHAPQK